MACALQALGIDAQVFHTNEGHAGFLGLERIRQAIVEHGLSLSRGDRSGARRRPSSRRTRRCRPASTASPLELIERYFAGWAAECGVSVAELMTLGQRIGDPPEERFNMAVMGLRLAGRSNAVSKLHGEVSREMFSDLWPDVPTEEIPITSVTNGVHALTWVGRGDGRPAVALRAARVGRGRQRSVGSHRRRRDDEVWRAKEQGRERLVAFVRRRLRESALARGLSASDVTWCDEVLDGKALTVCFARRFATYKRATLLLSQPERLRAMVLAGDRPVQFVFAGKAHPADETGKEMIREIVVVRRRPRHPPPLRVPRGLRHRRRPHAVPGRRRVAQHPRRPLEACGTSGMKAALNGGLNCSILDGWWDELFNGENGWAISSAEQLDDEERRDEVEANSLFELLERQIVPSSTSGSKARCRAGGCAASRRRCARSARR